MTTLLERAQKSGNPVTEGNTAAFVWQGDQPPSLRADFSNWDIVDTTSWQKSEPNVWTYQIDLPDNAYIEYCYGRDRRRTPDPLSKKTTPNGMGETNHYFYMPNGRPTMLTNRMRGMAYGSTTKHRISSHFKATSRRRELYLYQPQTPDPVPLLVVYDGVDYNERGKLPAIVDNLIMQRRISPIAMVMVDNGGKHGRMPEYACSESTLFFLTQDIIPFAQKRLNLIDIEANPGAYTIMGASMGGVNALFTALRLPHIFGQALSQSGAFAFDEFGYTSVAVDLLRLQPKSDLRVWMDVGQYEWLLEPNRRTHAILQEKGYDVAYQEYPGGHNYTSWRNDVGAGLEWLFSK